MTVIAASKVGSSVGGAGAFVKAPKPTSPAQKAQRNAVKNVIKQQQEAQKRAVTQQQAAQKAQKAAVEANKEREHQKAAVAAGATGAAPAPKPKASAAPSAPAPKAPAAPTPAPSPFLTPSQTNDFNNAWDEYQNNVTAQNAQIAQGKISYANQLNADQKTAIQNTWTANADAAARGLFTSSVHDGSLNDIAATKAINDNNALTNWNAISAGANAQLRLLSQEWANTQNLYKSYAVTNAQGETPPVPPTATGAPKKAATPAAPAAKAQTPAQKAATATAKQKTAVENTAEQQHAAVAAKQERATAAQKKAVANTKAAKIPGGAQQANNVAKAKTVANQKAKAAVAAQKKAVANTKAAKKK